VRTSVETAGRKFARAATRAVVARPVLWRLFKRPLRVQFDALAPIWEARREGASMLVLEDAFHHVEPAPARILDLGTGTGIAARFLAARFPDAAVVGADLSPKMIQHAREHLPGELADRVRFEVADAMRLPYEDGGFDLVVLLNMIPFFDELARVTSVGGHVVLGFSAGAETPIYVPPPTLRARFADVGFDRFEELAAGEATGFLARRSHPG
jgi:SAM-dependent methyltransferase